jgi:hypothetical protein
MNIGKYGVDFNLTGYDIGEVISKNNFDFFSSVSIRNRKAD